MSLQRAIVKGTAWMVGARWMVRGIGFVSTVILARLLAPADFGLVALATMLTGLIGVFGETGLLYYLIREPDPKREHFDTVWTLQTLFGAGLTALAFAAGPLFQGWFDKPDLGLAVQLLSLTLILQGAANPGVVWFRKDMDFGRDFLTILLPKVAGFVTTLTLAFMWRDHWALVCGILASNAMFFVQSYALHPFRPRFDLSRTRDVWSFSVWSLIHAIFEYLAEQIDTLLIGRFRSARDVGLYHVAYDVAGSPLVELSQPLNILVAEDNIVNIAVLRSMLKQLGHRSTFCENGETALAAYCKAPQRFDLILMDCEMPVLDGFGATRAIRAVEHQQGLRAIPIVALTAHAFREQQAKCLEAGMDHYLSKPITLATLTAVLRRYQRSPLAGGARA